MYVQVCERGKGSRSENLKECFCSVSIFEATLYMCFSIHVHVKEKRGKGSAGICRHVSEKRRRIFSLALYASLVTSAIGLNIAAHQRPCCHYQMFT